MQKRFFLLVAMLLTMTMGALAQVTTSSMAGKVTLEGSQEEIIGATVVAVHEPSGTRYTAVTNASGMFTIQGMRTGGPYAVTVSYIGHQTKTLKNITLVLGETYNLPVWLSESSTSLDEIVISGKATKLMTEKMGAATNITAAQISNMPTVSRSITDITRLSPYGGSGMSFAGSDGRTANFTVDGANFNNNFGLSSNLPGGGNPISIDALEELQVVISPYDVRQTNFIGGGVNAITKSGTNTIKGSAYIYHQNENLRGDAVDREEITGARAKDQKTTYGFTLGGPIIKNKLFLFVNGEMTKTPTVVNRWRGSDPDNPADPDKYVSRTTTADLQTVSDFVRTKYGYNTGSYTNFPADENNYKILARLDWNINDKHHLALRYNYTKNRYWASPNASSMDGGTRMSDARMSKSSMSYANSMYAMDNLVHSFSLDLNSRLTENLSNQLLATYSKLDDIRDSDSGMFPFVDILKDGNNYIALGYELFTWNNAVHNTIWNVKDDVTYYLGAHKITGGVSFEHQMADNMYMRNGTGYYRYSSLDDFLNERAPEIVALTYGYNGETDPAARVQFNKLGVYVQDDWNILDNLKLTYGLRVDGLFFDNGDLMTNKAIYDFDYNGEHIDTGKWPTSKMTLSPRLGFNWDVFGDQSLKVRGGTGLFSGRLPLVFFTNMPTNSNMVQYKGIWNSTGKSSGMLTDMERYFSGKMRYGNDLRDYVIENGLGPRTISPQDGVAGSTINAVNPDFKMPQVWKSSIAVDYQIPVSFPLTATVEAIFNKTINAVCISDWSIRDVGGFARLNGADNRALYQDFKYTDENGKPLPNAFVLDNTSKGYGWTFNAKLEAQPTDWLSLMASYTHTVSKELTGMPGSDASSAFTYIPCSQGPNNVRLHNSQYVTPDRIVANATLHDKSGNHYSFIYETWRGGNNTSYLMTTDMNGDGYAYDVVYIPTDKQAGYYDANGQIQGGSEFRFASKDDMDRFMAYVHKNDYLKSRQGKYTEAYSHYSPWVHRVDFAYKHDFKLNVGNTKHTLQLSFDVKNVMNLFNSSWGVSKVANQDFSTSPSNGVQYSKIMKLEGVDAGGYGVYSTPKGIDGNTKTWKPYHTLGQCWYASIGVKYFFN
ncbi:MAG: TonB-dependent receptor [Prevotella sp.]|nr:TonB-dependent receptor [Prevotella sp.]